ncbi:dihydrofolate reductase [Variovorax sp. J22P168]|uniref:dihydrofolate reductase n=1 Tax=Variovorax jilinensis TaxID=3053513 RepID=UPI00257691B6|nr:dihydrofolate reductase [Variovorax sp. J22P168]MDM0012857.1 dihydrofolate reductase [Variovorax sp. J22P168]
MRINLILARASNGVIGLEGRMPWQLPEDMAHFKARTMGAPVVMGRKTWDSIPPRFRPLPGRRNIVITRNAGWQAEGAERAASLQAAIALCRDAGAAECWVMGGGQIYAEAEPIAQRAIVTEIARDFEGDAQAPVFGPAWRETARDPHVAQNGLPFSFVTLERN